MNPKLFHIAIAMGVTITFAKLIFMLNWMIVQITDINFSALVETTGSFILLIQHCVANCGIVKMGEECVQGFMQEASGR